MPDFEAPFQAVNPETGAPVMSVEVSPEGYPLLQLFGPDGKPWVRLGALTPGLPGPSLEIRSPRTDEPVVVLGADEVESHGFVDVLRTDGTPAASVSATDTGARIEVLDRSGDTDLARLYSDGERGYVGARTVDGATVFLGFEA